MELSIITVNYRAWALLGQAMDKLHPDFPAEWEIIVVDNQSEPRFFNDYVARYPWVRFVANIDNSGFGFGCRIGVAASSGKTLLFMNPDVEVSVSDIRELLNAKSSQPDIAVVAPKQVDTNGRAQKVFDEFPDLLNQSKLLKALRRKLLPARFPDPRADYSELTFCDWVTGSVLLISRDDYERIGGWSVDFWMYGEDTDLCKRAADAGLRVAYVPHVTVMHAHGGSSRINVAVKSLTKLEVIISKHVYANRHFSGVKRWLCHLAIFLTRVPALLVGTLLNLVTFNRIPWLRVRMSILTGLIKHYVDVLRTGSWLSPRARANQSL